MAAALLALALLCPGRADLAPHVVEAGHRYLLHPVVLVAMVKAESNCEEGAINERTGAAGLMQILPRGSANPKRYKLKRLLDPATNLDLGARHLARLLALCGNLGGAYHVYHGFRKCRGWKRDKATRRLLGLVDKVRKAAKRKEKRT